MDILLGIDAGTSNIKAVLATPDGRVLATAQAAYSTHHPKPGWAEQSPEDWWHGLVGVVKEVIEQVPRAVERVAGIGISGQGCAVTLVNTSGDPLRPAIIWMDSRAEAQCETLRRCCSEPILRQNGKAPAPYNADPVLMWLAEHEPEALRRAQCSLTTTGYLSYRLTGEPVMNLSDASILFAFDLHTQQWSEELIDAFGLPRHLYPSLAACHEVVGTLTARAASELGLNPGIPVVAGGEDTSSAGLAIGVTRPNQALLSLGTAGTVYVLEERASVHPQLLTFLHVLPDQYLLGGSMVAVGAALDWYRRNFAPELEFPALTQLAATSDAGAQGLLFLPYLSGELQPINDGNARGVFFGLNVSSEPRHLVRAVLEGTAFAIAHNLLVAHEAGATISEIRAVGGPSKDPLWCQIISDVTNRPVGVLEDNPGAPLGNALLAAAGVGLIEDVAKVAARAARVSRTYEPNPEHRERYDGLFDLYRSLYPQLREPFAELAALAQGAG